MIIHKKFCLLAVVLFSHSLFGMEPQDHSKEQTVLKMIALRRPDFDRKYDEVHRLDLSKIGGARPVICVPSRTRMIYSGDKDPFHEERTFLRELAVTKEYAPLIPVLFKRWKNLEKHWIAQSMLLHAVADDMVVNAQELLSQNVDPNQPSYYFFQQNDEPKLAIEVAFGHQSSDMKCKSREMINLLFSTRTLKLEPQKGSEILLLAIEPYIWGSDEHFIVFEKLIENGANPFAKVPGGKTVKFNDEYYNGTSAHDLASQLLTAPVAPEEQQKDWYKSHKNRFQNLVLLFEKSKALATP